MPDPLAELVACPDGYVKVLDLNELAIALEKDLCEPHIITQALRKLDSLLNLIYDDKFDALTADLDRVIP